MKNDFADYITRTREDKGLSRGNVAKMMGYKNINKGSRKLVELERGGMQDAEFLEKLVRALGLGREKVAEMLAAREAEAEAAFQEWLEEPVPMKLTFRYVAGFYICQKLPEHILSEEAAIQWAAKKAIAKKREACLQLNRRWSVYIDRDGKEINRLEATREMPHTHSMVVKRKSGSSIFCRTEKGVKLEKLDEFIG